jgi:hypothetical protein
MSMGIYLPNMEMPKGTDEHRLIIRANGQVIIDKKTYWEEAEAVPVPPHGRLVDGDRLLSERMKRVYYHLPNGDTAIPIIDIEHAPTIIPASGKE